MQVVVQRPVIWFPQLLSCVFLVVSVDERWQRQTVGIGCVTSELTRRDTECILCKKKR
jgi:hypothetical protein